MTLKRYIKNALAAALTVTALAMPVYGCAEEAPAAAPAAATETAAQPAGENTQKVEIEEASGKVIEVNRVPEADKILPEKYTSVRYGFTINCPKKPDVIPVSMMSEGDKGDVLIFNSKGLDIQAGWMVCINGFEDNIIPDNLLEMNDQERDNFAKKFAKDFVMDVVRIMKFNGKPAVLGITAKNIEVDTDGDGKLDTVAEAENQMVKVFMRGEYGGNFVIGLIDNPTLSQEGINIFNLALTTFQQWPTSAYQKAKDEAAKNPKKKK